MLDQLSGSEDRFRQVKYSLRKEKEGSLPISLYGGREILTTSGWKRIIKKYNPQNLMEISDKVEQKLKLAKAGVPIPATYLIIDGDTSIEAFGRWLKKWDKGFALKPSKGHGGNGVLVVDRKVGGVYIRTTGRTIEAPQILSHAGDIVSGAFSDGETDRAIVEERIVLSRRLRELMTEGLIDIRVVVFRGFPIMAMTRLPTKRSEGRANIHQGALAAGISISEGRITNATSARRTVRKHPNTGKDLIGFGFGDWDAILEAASAAALAMEMGYVGVDLTVDANRGVLVIEVNKRPGLEIQNANNAGLLRRIRFVERMWRKEIKRTPELGPGVRAELSRSWDRLSWGRLKPEDLAEE
jgi:alpha-L-glutamate ligase-like protein